eukprot:TRINITY_DN718_c0_g1_i3.p1 TRINITY_DN718_c0_g1~~TRINITY_DN718_c0_g1_i3.p1  ORF type:complete len:217 (+),score=60.00 TRINITY_DN718_c0_g1_i3:179-829(+)
MCIRDRVSTQSTGEASLAMSLRAKIMVVGPKQSGKSAISDFLATQRESPKESYDPTAGVRIQEFEMNAPGKSPHSEGPRIGVELWDVSGDFVKYQQTWPAIQVDCDGCLFVAEAETLQSKSTEISDKWFRELVLQTVNPGQVTICAHSASATDRNQFPDCRLPSELPDMTLYKTSLNYPEGKQGIQDCFNQLLAAVATSVAEKRDRREEAIMQGGQ